MNFTTVHYHTTFTNIITALAADYFPQPHPINNRDKAIEIAKITVEERASTSRIYPDAYVVI